MPNELRRRVARIEQAAPANGADELTEIVRVMVEPGPDGPRDTGERFITCLGSHPLAGTTTYTTVVPENVGRAIGQ